MPTTSWGRVRVRHQELIVLASTNIFAYFAGRTGLQEQHLPNLSWASRFSFSLSESDQTLLQTQFAIADPRTLPNVRRVIPGDLKVTEVEFSYELGIPKSAGWIRCCQCQRDQNHQKGFVLRFEDETYATVGHNCGHAKHHLDHKEQIREFEARVHRASLLRQIQEMLQQGPQIVEQLEKIRADPMVRACASLKRSLEEKLPNFHNRLQTATGGRILGKRKVRDYDAERSRRARLEAKVERLSQIHRKSRTEVDVERELLARLVADRDPDASKEPIHKIEDDQLIHSFRGHEFFSAIPQAGSRALRVAKSIGDSFFWITKKSSADVSLEDMGKVRNSFRSALDDAIKLLSEIEAAGKFTDPENIQGIVKATNRFKKQDSPNRLELVEGTLFRVGAMDTPLVDVRIPSSGLVMSSSLERLRDVIFDAAAAVMDQAA